MKEERVSSPTSNSRRETVAPRRVVIVRGEGTEINPTMRLIVMVWGWMEER